MTVVIVFYILSALVLLAGLVLLVRAFLAPERSFEKSVVAVMVMVIASLLFVVGFLLANFNLPMGYGMMFPFRNQATVETEAAPVTDETSSPLEAVQEFFGHELAENHFTTKSIPACTPVNADWKKLFGYGNGYAIVRSDAIFPVGHIIAFEGVVTGTDPLHTTQVLTGTVYADQANLWDCGTTDISDEALHTLMFEITDKKWQDQTVQGLSKPYQTITPFGTYDYADGEKPAWAPTVVDVTSPICPFPLPALSDPAGVPTDGGFVGAPGKAGCDFVLVFSDGKTAIRYHSAIDSFFYPTGSHFYLFDPKLDNVIASAAIPGNPVITNSWK